MEFLIFLKKVVDKFEFPNYNFGMSNFVLVNDAVFRFPSGFLHNIKYHSSLSTSFFLKIPSFYHNRLIKSNPNGPQNSPQVRIVKKSFSRQYADIEGIKSINPYRETISRHMLDNGSISVKDKPYPDWTDWTSREGRVTCLRQGPGRDFMTRLFPAFVPFSLICFVIHGLGAAIHD